MFNAEVLGVLLAFSAGAIFQAVLAFMFDDIRARRAEKRLAEREATAAKKARWTKAIADTSAYCHAMVSWLQRRATLQREEMGHYLRQLDGTVYPDRNIDLLGNAGLEYMEACNKLFGMKLEPGRDDSLAIARVAGHALVTVNRALKGQQERADAGLDPIEPSAEARERVETEFAAFMQHQQDRVDELMRLLSLGEKGVRVPKSAVPK